MTQGEYEIILDWLDKIRGEISRLYNMKASNNPMPQNPNKWVNGGFVCFSTTYDEKAERAVHTVNAGCLSRCYAVYVKEKAPVVEGQNIIDQINLMEKMILKICKSGGLLINIANQSMLNQNATMREIISKLRDLYQYHFSLLGRVGLA